MIVVDTSALMAIILREPAGDALSSALEVTDRLLISAGTVAEALIVAGQRNVGDEMAQLIEGLGLEIVAVTTTAARDVASAYRRWGKGNHPAALNFGDCFGYSLAIANDCPLLYVGKDFARTDLKNVL